MELKDGLEVESAGSRWDRLPTDIWERILTILPVSAVAVSTAVCRSWRSIIRSRPFVALYSSVPSRPSRDLYFLLFSGEDASSPVTTAYHPFDDRWVQFPLTPFSCPSSCCVLRRVHVSGGGHLLVEQANGAVGVYNVFTGRFRSVAPMIAIYSQPYALSLIEEDPTRFKIVAVSTADMVRSQVYDSKARCWVMKGQFAGRFAMLGSSAYLNGTLYCLGHTPNCLLAFDMAGGKGKWSLFNAALPSLCCSHILAHRGALFLVGGLEMFGEVTEIGIWQLKWGEMKWEELCFMPDGLFRRFSGIPLLQRFEIMDQSGVICFRNTDTYNNIVMCDLSTMRWWRPVPCPFPVPRKTQLWFGHAVEPRVELVLPSD